MGPIFRYVAHFMEYSVAKQETSRLPIVFHPIRKIDSELTMKLLVLLSFLLCRTENVTQRPIIHVLEEKKRYGYGNARWMIVNPCHLLLLYCCFKSTLTLGLGTGQFCRYNIRINTN